jgi:hypothetical protein
MRWTRQSCRRDGGSRRPAAAWQNALAAGREGVVSVLGRGAAVVACAVVACAVVACALLVLPAGADLGSPEPSALVSLRSFIPGSGGGPVLAQRAIEEDEAAKKKKPAEPAPAEPVPAEPTPAAIPEAAAAVVEPVQPKSPTKAFLLSALLPGMGELYAGSNRGYIFLGIEAASWITFASYRASGNDKEDEMYAYADRNFSIAAFEEGCVGQPGQPCQEALDAINNFYENDKGEYYEIISKNAIYKPGWGVDVQPDGSFTYENCPVDLNCPPDPTQPGQEAAYRAWVADQAAAQDGDYASYNGLRDDRNSLDSKARGATMVVLVNHLVSAFDALLVARSFNADLPQGVSMDLKIKGSFSNPGAKVVFKRQF